VALRIVPSEFRYHAFVNKRLKQPKGRMTQLRMFAASEMPPELLAPLEKDVVAITKRALEKMGYKVWSGRVAIFDPTPEAREQRVERGWPLFIPALEPGCPDLLGIFPERKGQLWGLEFKRDAPSSKERASQIKWREMASYWGILCATVRTSSEAISYLEAHRRRG